MDTLQTKATINESNGSKPQFLRFSILYPVHGYGSLVLLSNIGTSTGFSEEESTQHPNFPWTHCSNDVSGATWFGSSRVTLNHRTSDNRWRDFLKAATQTADDDNIPSNVKHKDTSANIETAQVFHDTHIAEARFRLRSLRAYRSLGVTLEVVVDKIARSIASNGNAALQFVFYAHTNCEQEVKAFFRLRSTLQEKKHGWSPRTFKISNQRALAKIDECIVAAIKQSFDEPMPDLNADHNNVPSEDDRAAFEERWRPNMKDRDPVSPTLQTRRLRRRADGNGRRAHDFDSICEFAAMAHRAHDWDSICEIGALQTVR